MSKIIQMHGDEYYKRKSHEFYEKAMLAITKEQYDEALEYFQQTYSFNPENQDAYFYIGLVAYILNKFELAIEIFANLFEKDNKNYEYAYRYGRGLYEQGSYQKSVEIFSEIPEEDEHYHDAQLYLAKSLHKEGKNSESANVLISLLSKRPNICDIRFELASIYVESKKFHAAIIELEKCIEIDEEYILAYYLLHDLYVELDETQNAIEILDALKEKCPYEEELIQRNLDILNFKKQNRQN